MQRINSLEKPLMLGKIEGKRRSGQQRMSWLESIINSMDVNLSELWEKDRGAWHAAVRGLTKGQTWHSGWTTANYFLITISWVWGCVMWQLKLAESICVILFPWHHTRLQYLSLYAITAPIAHTIIITLWFSLEFTWFTKCNCSTEMETGIQRG